MESPSNRRLIGFLAISVALHALWLAVPLPTRTALIDTPPPLVARLMPRADRSLEPARTEPTQKSAVAARLPDTSPALSAPESSAATPADPAIDVDAAYSVARGYARETQPHILRDAPKPVLTVEAAVARATQPDVVIETHGAAGEYVTKTRKLRCVTPTYIPHFLEGKTMLTQCEALKG
jgi:hypothetical protein